MSRYLPPDCRGTGSRAEKGIIHRDLKPANVIVGPEGRVKVLDFGLAKSVVEERSPSDLSKSPTLTREGTEHGVIARAGQKLAAPSSPLRRGILEREAFMDYAAHFVRDSEICGGETVFRGTRVLLRTVLADLADGATMEQILKDFPSLNEQHLRAAIAFAAAAARDDIPVPASADSR